MLQHKSGLVTGLTVYGAPPLFTARLMPEFFQYERPLDVRGPAVWDPDNEIYQHEMLSMRGASLSSASFHACGRCTSGTFLVGFLLVLVLP